MKKSIQKVFATVFIILIVITVVAILDSTIDLSSEYAEAEAQKQLDRYVEAFVRNQENKDWYERRKQLIAMRQEHQQIGENASLWAGISQEKYLEEARAWDSFDIDAWLASQERNTGCPDCQWFSAIAYLQEERPRDPDAPMEDRYDNGSHIATEVCPYCGKALWDMIAG